MEIGSRWLQEVNLTIPQSTSLPFDIVHEDDEGHVVDHRASVPHMKFQTKDKRQTFDLDECVECGAERIRVSIPASITEDLPAADLNWDLIVVMQSGEPVCLVGGKAHIKDSYAMDEPTEA